MRVLVTGAAGFIGSHVVERMLADGHEVVAVDNFDPYYARATKEANMVGFRTDERVVFHELDLAEADLEDLVRGVTGVVHLAATAGVRGSWGDSFSQYQKNNVLATQRLLEALRREELGVFVYGGSASVYGDAAVSAVSEDYLPAPYSPYGVTKLAAEHLAHLYRHVHGLPTLSLRLFSCYGPRERPDKAIQKFLLATVRGTPVNIYGDGSQRRDFTYVGDIVDGIAAAVEKRPVGEVINLARGETISLSEVLESIQSVTGKKLDIRYTKREAGDVRVTHANIQKAERLLDYSPSVGVAEGIRRQWQTVQASLN